MTGTTVATYYPATVTDIHGYNSGGTNWGNLHDATTGVLDSGITEGKAVISSIATTDLWDAIIRTPFSYDTSSIGKYKYITAATFSFYTSATTNDYSETVVLVSGALGSNTAIASGDYDGWTTTELSSRKDINEITTNAWNKITFNNTGCNYITQKKYGYTTFFMMVGADVSGTVSWLESSTSKVAFNAMDVSTKKPYLEVTIEDIPPATTNNNSWISFASVDDPSIYTTICNLYATTLPVDAGYGIGDITVDFATVIGTTTPATLWRIGEDIYRADINTDISRVVTVSQGRSSKICGGTVYSLVSDWATHLRTATFVDTYLTYDASAGATIIYVVASLTFNYNENFAGTPGIFLSPNTSRYEKKTATSTGAIPDLAKGPYILLTTGLTYDHYAYDDCLNGKLVRLTGNSSTECISWLNTVFSTTTDSSYGWMRVGSEILPAVSVLSTTTGTTLTSAVWNSATVLSYDINIATTSFNRNGSNTFSYVHGADIPVFCQPTVGVNQTSTSYYNQYGPIEGYVNPIAVVDGNTMDLLSWNTLQKATQNLSWGRFVIGATTLPATISIGDWVNIEEDIATGTVASYATTAYRIVGLEYDQKQEIYYVEIGSTEDYYLEKDNRVRGISDLTLANT